MPFENPIPSHTMATPPPDQINRIFFHFLSCTWQRAQNALTTGQHFSLELSHLPVPNRTSESTARGGQQTQGSPETRQPCWHQPGDVLPGILCSCLPHSLLNDSSKSWWGHANRHHSVTAWTREEMLWDFTIHFGTWHDWDCYTS